MQHKLLEHEPHAALPAAGKETPYNLRTRLNVAIASAALVLTDGGQQQILRAGLDDLKAMVKVFPQTLEVLAAVQAMGCTSPEGTLIRTGSDLRRASLAHTASAKALQGAWAGLHARCACHAVPEQAQEACQGHLTNQLCLHVGLGQIKSLCKRPQ